MYFNCCDDAEGEYKKWINHYKIQKKNNQKNKNKRQNETKLLRHRNWKVKNIMLLLLIKTKKLLFVSLFLFTFTRGVMNSWDQIREARPYHERDSSSKSDFNTQANQRKRKTIYCELNTHWTLGRTRKVIPPPWYKAGGRGGGVDWTPPLHCNVKWQILDK